MRLQKQAGFSLLELLVALFIVVIITSLVTLAVNSGGQDVALDARVRSLANVSGFALDEAQMRGVDMGLFIEQSEQDGDTRYRVSWMERYPEGWRRPVVNQAFFSTQQFPSGIELALLVDDKPVDIISQMDLALQASSPDSNRIERDPQVIFYSSGETTVGSIDLRKRDDGELLWRIEWDLLGRFSLLRRGEAPVDEADEVNN